MKSAIRVLLLGSAVALAPLACSSKSAEEANLQENSLPDADPALDKKPAHAMATKEKATTVVEGNNCFAFDLYARLSQEKSNLFFSPHSISNALAMTYDGARGNTAIEMKNVLHFPFDQNGLAFFQVVPGTAYTNISAWREREANSNPPTRCLRNAPRTYVTPNKMNKAGPDALNRVVAN